MQVLIPAFTSPPQLLLKISLCVCKLNHCFAYEVFNSTDKWKWEAVALLSVWLQTPAQQIVNVKLESSAISWQIASAAELLWEPAGVTALFEGLTTLSKEGSEGCSMSLGQRTQPFPCPKAPAQKQRL